MCPAYLPSMAMWMMVPTLWQSMVIGSPSFLMSLALPAATAMAVYPGRDAVAADLLDILQRGCGRSALPYAFCEALADGVRGRASRPGPRIPAASRLPSRCGARRVTSNTPWVSVPVLSKTTTLRLGEGLQVVGALDEDALLARAADARQRSCSGNADDQRARAADDQEGQRAVDPVSPRRDPCRRRAGPAAAATASSQRGDARQPGV